jgi:putative GTP pyrophosphokinase
MEGTQRLSPEEWGDRYRLLRPTAEACTGQMRRLVDDLLETAQVEVAQVENRTKGVSNFVDKIYRKNEKYNDPLTEITDVCGLRIITYYLSDVDRVGVLIEREFDVDWENSERQVPDSVDRFGYRSDHYVLRMSEARRDLPEWAPYQDLVVEIQVRTVMQHAWAAVDHKVRYKGQDLPPTLHRRLSRLSALMETADEQFAEIQRESEEMAAAYAESLAEGDLDLGIDSLSVRGYLHESEKAIEWMNIAVGLGYEPIPLPEPELPAYLVRANLDEFMAGLGALGANTIEDVAKFFESAQEWGLAALARVLEVSGEREFTPVASPNDIVAFLALIAAGNDDVTTTLGYRDELVAGLLAASADLHSS